MLIACPDGEAMVRGLSQEGIPATVVGHAAPSGQGLYTPQGEALAPPGADELYRLFSK